MKFLFYIVIGGIAAFYILKALGYTTFSQVEGDVRGAGKAISRTAGDVSDTVKDGVDEVKKESQ